MKSDNSGVVGNLYMIAAVLVALGFLVISIDQHLSSVNRAQWHQVYWLKQQALRCGP